MNMPKIQTTMDTSTSEPYLRRVACLLGFVFALGAVPACGDDDGEEALDREGLRMCCVLGAQCHIDEGDPIDGAKQMCHSIGHENDPVQCRQEYDACMAICEGGEGEVEHACL